MAEQKRGGPRGHGPQGHGFQRPKDFRGTVSKLLRYIGRYKAALVVVFICLVISSVGSVMSSYLLKPIINDYILVGDFAGLLKMLALLLGLFLLSGLCSYAYARIMVHISQRTVAQMRQDLFDKLQDLPLRYFDTHQSGDLMSRFTNDMDTVSEMINSSFASVVSCALTFIGIVVMMLYMNWVLTLITFAFLVLMLLVVKGVGGRSRVSFQAQQQALGAMNGYIEEMVEGQKVIKVFNHESKAIAQFSGLNDSYRDAATAAQTYSGAMMPAMANLSRIDYAVTCCVGGLLAIGGMFDVGSLGAYLLYVKQVSQPISQISQQVNVLLAAVAGAERIFAVMDAQPETDEGKTVIVRVEKDGDTLTIKRMLEDGYMTIKVKTPCMITCIKELNTPRYLSVGGAFECYSKPLVTMTYETLKDHPLIDKSTIGLAGSPTNILTSFTPPQKGAGMMLEGADKATTDKLAGILAAKHII